ncbi:MAG: DEAD/DEAH box helicase [Desulfurococcales archaeon]|nr:DEAD/DEAH box helicase [Desulfurococcales archaeon]
MSEMLGLTEGLLKAARKVGIKEFTEIQELAIPKVLRGRHVLIAAPTGSGKTEAALLPIMSELLERGRKPISAVYVTPLRALNRDIFLRIRRLGREVGIKVAVRHGDTSASARRAVVRSPPDILVTTPETLAYLLVSEGMREHLKHVRWVVIDEFHELLGSKRGTHLLADLERLRNVAGPFQRVALSATVGDVRLAAEALAPDKVVDIAEVPGVRNSELKVVAPNPSPEGKVEAIASLIRENKPVLVFTNTRDEAEWLAVKLRSLGLKVRVHHGSLARAEREEVERELREGSIDAVVSTSSLELGIDVGDVNAVIQSSSPRQVMKFVQRVGRSLHRFSEVAKGFIVTDLSGDDMFESLVIARRAKAGNVEVVRPYRNSLDVLAHVVVGMGLETGSLGVDESFETVRRSYPYRDLESETFDELIDRLSFMKYLRLEGGGLRTTFRGKLYYLRTTMIVDTEQYRVIDSLTYRTVGKLDSDFVRISVSEGSTIVLSGRLWRVLAVDDSESKVFVEEVSGEEALIPSWVGENIPVDYKVAREVCGLRRLIALNHIPREFLHLGNEVLLKYLSGLVRTHMSRGYPLPHEGLVLVEAVSGSHAQLLIVHACLGSRGNRAFSYLLTYPFVKYLGVEPRVKVDPYRVYLEVPPHISLDAAVRNVRESLFKLDPTSCVKEMLMRSGLGALLTHKVLSRLGVIPREAPSQVVKVLIRKYFDDPLVRSEVVNEAFTKYLDIGVLAELLEGVRRGKVGVKFIEVSSPSPLGGEGLKVTAGFDRVRGTHLPKDLIAELVRRRLLSKEVRLYCMVCGYSWVSRISELPERIRCPRCGNSLIAPYFGRDDVSEVVVKGLKAGRRYKFALSGEERRVFEELLDSADLVLTYGRRAVEALAARGVGPRTARRLLGKRDDVSFYSGIYEAERTYLRTRRFWDRK